MFTTVHAKRQVHKTHVFTGRYKTWTDLLIFFYDKNISFRASA